MDGGRVGAGRNLCIRALRDNIQPVPTEKLNSAPLPPVTLATKREFPQRSRHPPGAQSAPQPSARAPAGASGAKRPRCPGSRHKGGMGPGSGPGQGSGTLEYLNPAGGGWQEGRDNIYDGAETGTRRERAQAGGAQKSQRRARWEGEQGPGDREALPSGAERRRPRRLYLQASGTRRSGVPGRPSREGAGDAEGARGGPGGGA